MKELQVFNNEAFGTVRAEEDKTQCLVLHTVAACIVSMLTDTFTTSEADTILEMVTHELHSEDETYE